MIFFSFLVPDHKLVADHTSWITLLKVYDVERPETPKDLGKNITDDVVRGRCGCIP